MQTLHAILLLFLKLLQRLDPASPGLQELVLSMVLGSSSR
jgi:hypothetical protein